jgi:predicted molibdopterin-dependent oxidoreductase YjgC
LNTIEILAGIERGEIQGLVVVGKEALGAVGNGIFGVPLFSVYIDTEMPGNPPYPHVILPGATFAESEGTYTNCERRIQTLHQACIPPAGKQNWEIIAALSKSLGYPMNYNSSSDIYAEMVKILPMFNTPGNTIREPSVQWVYSKDEGFGTEKGLARFNFPEQKATEISDLMDILK